MCWGCCCSTRPHPCPHRRPPLAAPQVDIASTLYPGVVAAPLIMGTLAGCGGKLVGDVIRHGWGSLAQPAEATVPSFVWRSAFLSALAYWATCKATMLLTPEEASALIMTALVRPPHALGGSLVLAAVECMCCPHTKMKGVRGIPLCRVVALGYRFGPRGASDMRTASAHLCYGDLGRPHIVGRLKLLAPARPATCALLAQLLHTLLSELSGLPLDFTYPLARVAHALRWVRTREGGAGGNARAPAAWLALCGQGLGLLFTSFPHRARQGPRPM